MDDYDREVEHARKLTRLREEAEAVEAVVAAYKRLAEVEQPPGDVPVPGLRVINGEGG